MSRTSAETAATWMLSWRWLWRQCWWWCCWCCWWWCCWCCWCCWWWWWLSPCSWGWAPSRLMCCPGSLSGGGEGWPADQNFNDEYEDDPICGTSMLKEYPGSTVVVANSTWYLYCRHLPLTANRSYVQLHRCQWWWWWQSDDDDCYDFGDDDYIEFDDHNDNDGGDKFPFKPDFYVGANRSNSDDFHCNCNSDDDFLVDYHYKDREWL